MLSKVQTAHWETQKTSASYKDNHTEANHNKTLQTSTKGLQTILRVLGHQNQRQELTRLPIRNNTSTRHREPPMYRTVKLESCIK